jgi:putative transposase
MRLREGAAARVRFGYRRLTVLLRREGWPVNAKWIYRLYTEEGLMVRTKVRVRAARRNRVPQAMATAPNQRWSMDFMSERVADGRWFRILTVVDQFTRECLCLVADQSLTGEKVAQAFPGPGRPKDEELAHLKRELARVKKERDFLQEAAAFFAKGSR